MEEKGELEQGVQEEEVSPPPPVRQDSADSSVLPTSPALTKRSSLRQGSVSSIPEAPASAPAPPPVPSATRPDSATRRDSAASVGSEGVSGNGN